MICPIRYIRTPEAAECVKGECSFWVEGVVFTGGLEAPGRFSAVRGFSDQPTPSGEESVEIEGKCSVLAIAEYLVKQK